MPGSKETKTQKVLSGEEPELNLRYNHKLVKVPAVARVQIHAASAPQGKDTLVLRSTEGTRKGECTYWKERPVKEASMSDGFLNLSFSPGRNDGTAERARPDRRYTLAWRPGGKKEAEVVLLEDRPYEAVWKTSPDDTPNRIAELMAVRFQETAGMILPDRSPAVLSGPDVPGPVRETDEDVADAGAPLPYDRPMPDPETATPMKSRSGSGGDQGGGGGQRGQDSGADLPPGPRWITLLRRRDEGQIELLGTYKVSAQKKYQIGTFSGQGPASAGGGQKDVLLPVGDGDVFGRMSMVPPTKTRIKQQARRLDRTESARFEIDRKGPGHSFVPLPLGEVLSTEGPTPAIPQLESPSQSSGSGPGGTARLPNPLAAAQRRLGTAKTAHKRFTAWRKKVKDTVGLTGLVGGTCFNNTFGRTYLQRALRPAKTNGATTNGKKAGDGSGASGEGNTGWSEDFLQKRPFRSDGEGMGPFSSVSAGGLVELDSDKHLGRVLHGHRCQWSYLTLKRDRALRAARGVFTSASFEALIHDVAVLKKGNDKGNAAGSILRVIGQTTSLGEGASVAEALCEDGALEGPVGSVLSALMSGQKGVLAPEGPAEAPMLKALLKLGQRSKGTLKAFAVNAAPAILAVGARKSDLFTSVDAPASLALLGAFLTAEGSGGSVSVSTGTDPEDRKTLRVQGGSTATFVQKRVPGLSHRRAEEQTRWGVQGVDGLSSVTVGAGGAPSDALELAVVGAMRREQPASGALSVKDGFGHVKTATELAESATDRAALSGLVTILTGVEVAWGVVDALSAEREQGWQTVDDPKYFTAGATLLKLVVGGAAATTAGSAAGSAAVGFLVGWALSKPIDAAAAWLERWENVDEDIADDPLIEKTVVEQGTKPENVDLAEQSKTEMDKYAKDKVQYGGWLAEKSHWGAAFAGEGAARDALAKLVEPGKDKSAGAPPPKPFRDQTKAFVEKAFTFPTAVGVPPRPSLPESNAPSASGPPSRLYFSIIPGHVPKKRGTFMIDALLRDLTMEREMPIKGVLHYVQTPKALRYKVHSADEPLDLPAGTSLADRAESECWAIGWKDKTPVPGGGTAETVHLPVHVEPGQRITEWPVQELTKAYVETVDLELGLYRSQQSMKDLSAEERSRLSQARKVERRVSPSSVLPAGGIESILQSGRFQVTGDVYFAPLQPFQPDPKIPSGREEARKKFMAFQSIGERQEVGFRYPEDAR